MADGLDGMTMCGGGAAIPLEELDGDSFRGNMRVRRVPGGTLM